MLVYGAGLPIDATKSRMGFETGGPILKAREEGLFARVGESIEGWVLRMSIAFSFCLPPPNSSELESLLELDFDFDFCARRCLCDCT